MLVDYRAASFSVLRFFFLIAIMSLPFFYPLKQYNIRWPSLNSNYMPMNSEHSNSMSTQSLDKRKKSFFFLKTSATKFK